MSGEFFPDNSIITNQKLPYSLKLLYQRWEKLFEREKRPRDIEWEKAFGEDHANYLGKEEYFLPQKRTLCVRLRVLSYEVSRQT